MLGLGARWKCGWQRNGNGWQGIEWGVPYEGTASGAELTLDELKEKVAQLAAANNTSWDDGRIMIWRVPASEADESIPMSVRVLQMCCGGAMRCNAMQTLRSRASCFLIANTFAPSPHHLWPFALLPKPQANKHPEIFMDFHPTTTDRFFSNKWHHPYPYMP